MKTTARALSEVDTALPSIRKVHTLMISELRCSDG
jgi:hypothetical protein